MNKKDIEKDKKTIQDITTKISADKKILKKQFSILNDLEQEFLLIGDFYNTTLPHKKELGPIFDSLSMSLNASAAFIIPMEVEEIKYSAFIGGTSTSFTTTFATMTSAIHGIAGLEALISRLDRVNKSKREAQSKAILHFLSSVFPHLVDSYKGAWESLHNDEYDPGRGALGKIREVVNQIVSELGPKGKRGRITWRNRFIYVFKRYSKSEEAKILLNNSVNVFLQTTKQFNKIHSRQEIKKETVENLMYQADDLLFKLAENLDIAKKKENGPGHSEGTG